MLIDVLFNKIMQRPAMYFGEPNLTCFRAFMDGWQMDVTNSEIRHFMNGFHDWVVRRYEVRDNVCWTRIIRYHSTSDTVALQNTFTLMQEYRAEFGPPLSE